MPQINPGGFLTMQRKDQETIERVAEYCRYYDYTEKTPNVLDSYVSDGGLAGSYVYREKEQV